MRLLPLILSLAASSAYGQTSTNYVWPQSPSAPHDGSDWAHAFTSMPTLVRDRAYYCATGSISAFDFTTAESGTLPVLVKKATVGDHGTQTGWNNDLGTNQFIFTGQIASGRDYLIIDGSYRDESNIPYSWTNRTAYGFQVLTTGVGGGNETSLDLNANNWPPGADNCRFSYMLLGGAAGMTYSNAPGHAVYCPGGGSGFVFHHCCMANTWVPILSRETPNMTNLYNAVVWSYSKEGWISFQGAYGNGNNWLMRSNLLLNTGIDPNAEGPTCQAGGFTLSPGAGPFLNCDWEWNVFARESGVTMQNMADGTVFFGDQAHAPTFSVTNNIIANNAVYNLPGNATFTVWFPADNIVTNNQTYGSLVLAVQAVFGGGTPEPPVPPVVVPTPPLNTTITPVSPRRNRTIRIRR